MTGAAEPAQASADQVALAMDPKYAAGLSQGRARAALLWAGADWRAMGLEAAIFVERPLTMQELALLVLCPIILVLVEELRRYVSLLQGAKGAIK